MDPRRQSEPLPEAEGWNFRALIVQGTLFEAARSLASPRLVLPFLYLALGAPAVFAGLISPLVQFAQLVSQIVSAPVVTSSQTRKWYLVLCNAAMACVLAIVALASRDTTPAPIVLGVFLVVALAIGALKGLNTLAFSDLIGRALRPVTRNQLLFLVSAIAGAVTIAAAWASPRLAGDAEPLHQHVTLLWIGVAITALAALPSLVLREDLSRPVPTRARGVAGFAADMREGFARAAGIDWFRRYVVARMMLVSVTLAMPFYAVHGADLHAGKSGSLGTFVVATSAAVIVGGPLWHRLAGRSQRLALCAGAVITALAGVWALVIEMTPALQTVGHHAIVFGLVSLGTQGVSGAQTLYLVNAAPEADRPYYVAVASGLTGALGVVVAFAFGAVAHLQGTEWPVAMVAGLNLAAVWACARLTPPSELRSATGRG